MEGVLRIIIFVTGAVFIGAVMYLLIKKKISEKTSLMWIFGTVIVFIFSIHPKLLDKLAASIGVHYPPGLLFLYAILILLFITLIHSIQISALTIQVKELTQQIAINKLMEEKQNKNTDAKNMKSQG